MTTIAQRARSWLLTRYLVDCDSNQRLLDCIFQQDETLERLRHFGAVAEHYRAQRWGDDSEIETDDYGFDHADGFVLTAFVECHEGPHTDDCPYASRNYPEDVL